MRTGKAVKKKATICEKGYRWAGSPVEVEKK